jgi:hypothetical protein
MIVLLIAGMPLNSMKAASQAVLAPKVDSVRKQLSLRILPRNFYTNTLSWSCKKEIQLQRTTRLPLYIRLGSKDHVDYLEGKSKYVDAPRVHGPIGISAHLHIFSSLTFAAE